MSAPNEQPQPPGHGQPPYGSPYGQPAYGQPPYGSPYGQPGYGQPPYGAVGPGHPGYGRPGPGSPWAGVRFAPGVGLVVALAGGLCLVLSLFALSWAKGSKGSFGDLSSAARKAGSKAVGDGTLYTYLAWAGYTLVILAVVLALVATLPVPPTMAGNTYVRVPASLCAGIGGFLHAFTMGKINTNHGSLLAGEWIGLVGWALLLIAMILGARRVRS